jgi:hypothetical protein
MESRSDDRGVADRLLQRAGDSLHRTVQLM